jgi:hypothetical protein
MCPATLHRLVGTVTVVLLVSACGSGGRPPRLQATFSRPGGLIPAVSHTPAAGICPEGGLVSIVKVYVGDGTPDPRCLRVRPQQELEVVNAEGPSGPADKTVTVTWPPFGTRRLKPGQAILFQQKFRSYLATGDHLVGVSRHHGGGPEIWLRQ